MMPRPLALRRGATLLELIAAISILALAASLSALALGLDWSRDAADHDGLREALHQAKRQAIATGRPVTIEWLHAPAVGSASERSAFTAFPDGSVAGEKELGIALLTGEIADSTRRVAR